MSYERKYSDYIVWSQLLEYAKENNLSDLIFVTDDNKEDWWLKVKQQGFKTISPRPELVGEITQETSVQRFHMYSSEGFLSYANKLLNIEVSEDAINEVRDVSSAIEKEVKKHKLLTVETANALFYKWLCDQFQIDTISSRRGFMPFDFVVDSNGSRIGYK